MKIFLTILTILLLACFMGCAGSNPISPIADDPIYEEPQNPEDKWIEVAFETIPIYVYRSLYPTVSIDSVVVLPEPRIVKIENSLFTITGQVFIKPNKEKLYTFKCEMYKVYDYVPYFVLNTWSMKPLIY